MKLTKELLEQFIKEEIEQEKWISAGGVVVSDDNQKVYVFKPFDNYGPWAFPKGRIDEGETEKQAALREVEEETGIVGKIMSGNSYLGTGEGSRSITHYFLMNVAGGDPNNFRNDETEEVRLVTWQEAIDLFKGAGNDRDIKIALKAMKVLNLK